MEEFEGNVTKRLKIDEMRILGLENLCQTSFFFKIKIIRKSFFREIISHFAIKTPEIE